MAGAGALGDAAATAEAVAERWGSWAELAMELADVASAVKEVRAALDADDRGGAGRPNGRPAADARVAGAGGQLGDAPPTGDTVGGGTDRKSVV